MNESLSAAFAEKKKNIFKKRAETLSRPVNSLEEQKKFLIEIIPFTLDREFFALETKFVKEIYPFKEYTILPCAPNFVYGLTNVRRRILPIIDLKVLFSIPNNHTKLDRKLLIMETEDIEIAILIDDFNGIRTVSKDDIQSSLPTFTGIRQDFLKGLLLDGTVILDGQKLLTSPYLAIDASSDQSQV
jgi:purine-binding chemotaxis protein CheW